MTISSPISVSDILDCPALERADLSSVRQYICGGCFVSETMCAQIRPYLPNGDIHIGYGMTEVGGVIAVNNPPKPSSVGLLRDGVQMIIVDDDGKRCGINQNGEICVKAPFPFMGYFDNDEMTRAACDTDGWLRSGDIGYFDADGYLFMVDRKKEIFKYDRYDIVPSEIESVLIGHPSVKFACVVAIPYVKTHNLPAAVIVTKANAQLSEKDILEYLDGESSDLSSIYHNICQDRHVLRARLMVGADIYTYI